METARIFWVLSLFIPGLHRFYLGKWFSGLLYLFTGGIGYIGTIVDFFRLPKMVADANRELEYRKILYPGIHGPSPIVEKPVIEKKKESIEKVILRTAKKNDGIITPGEVALDGEISLDQAKEYLEKLATKGYAEMRVKKNGVIVFCFPEFMPDTKDIGFEDF